MKETHKSYLLVYTQTRCSDSPSSMALASLLNTKCSIKFKGSTLSLSFFLIPHISSSLFSSSSLCKDHPFSPPQQSPPLPKKDPFTVLAHGKTWQDPYHWMSNTNDPDLSDYLTQENSYAEAFMADTHHLQRTLFSEMKSRMPTSISTPPERWGPWFVHFPPTPFRVFTKAFSFINSNSLDWFSWTVRDATLRCEFV